MDIDYLYRMEATLNKLLMFKYLHDAGFDVKQFNHCNISTYNDYGLNEGFHNFATVGESIFEIFEVYSSYEAENYADKEYWLNEANAIKHLSESVMIIVILDSSLDASTGYVGVSYLTGEAGEAFQIDGGTVLVFDTDFGEPDWADTMLYLLESRINDLCKEDMNNEMAV